MALLDVTPGDVVPIPARLNGVVGFVLSRVIASQAAYVVEVFNDFRTDYSSVAACFEQFGFLIEDRLFAPVLTAFHFSKFVGRVRWPILGKMGDPVEWNERNDIVEFKEHDYDKSGRFFRGGIRCREDQGIRRALEDLQIYSNVQLIFRINLHLAGVLAPGEPFPPQRMASLIEKNGTGWLESEYEGCKQLADEVGTRFKEAQGGSRKRSTLAMRLQRSE